MTLLVVFHHAALTYGGSGDWYYREVPVGDGIGGRLLILFCTVNQAFFMGLFFLIAGYFTPASVARRGAARFVRERLLRLGLPLLAYVLVIGPATIALAQTARGRPFVATLLRLWDRRTVDVGPLWFAEALLLFALAYVAWRAVRPARGSVRPFPSNAAMLAAAASTAAAAFALRLVWPVGTVASGLQLGYFASYVVLFAAGCAGAAGQWLDAVPDRQRRLWLAVAWLAVPVLPAVVLLAPAVPLLRGAVAGGWNVPAAVYAVWEPLVAWGFILALVGVFGRRFARLGPVGAALSRRAFAIYVIHPPVLVAVALAWRAVPAPHLVKFAVTGSVACLACFWVAGWLLRVHRLARVL